MKFRILTAAAVALLPLKVSAQTSAVRVIYVAPVQVGSALGSGTHSDPFVLTAGREYDLDALIQPIVNAGVPLTVEFEDGTYRNVRLQIIKKGTDAITRYQNEVVNGVLVYNGGRAAAKGSGTSYHLLDSDYAFGSGPHLGTLLLTALNPGKAIFDGTDTRDSPLGEDSLGLNIAGSSLEGGTRSAPYAMTSLKITGVTVRGLVFQNYRNALSLSWASGNVIDRVTFQDIGLRIPRTSARQPLSVYAINVSGDSRLNVIENSTVANTYNPVGKFATTGTSNPVNDPVLIHSVYMGSEHDTFFIRDTFTNSSGPIWKIADYPSAIYTYPSSPIGFRRNFVINSTFNLGVIADSHGTQPDYSGEDMVDDNSTQSGSTRDEGPPASGQVFVNDTFNDKIPSRYPSSVFRQEVDRNVGVTSLPGWVILGNRFTGVAQANMLVDRVRGNGSVGSFETSQTDLSYVRQFGMVDSATAPQATGVAAKLVALISGPLASGDPVEDAAAIKIVQDYVQ